MNPNPAGGDDRSFLAVDAARAALAGKTADFDQPGREYTAGDSLGLKRNQ